MKSTTTTSMIISNLGPGIPEAIRDNFSKYGGAVSYKFYRNSGNKSKFVITGDYFVVSTVCQAIQEDIRLMMAQPAKMLMESAIAPIAKRYGEIIGQIKVFKHPYDFLYDLVGIYITIHWFIVGAELKYQHNEMNWPFTSSEVKKIPSTFTPNLENADVFFELIERFFKLANIPKFDVKTAKQDYQFAEGGYRRNLEPHEQMLRTIWSRVVSFRGFGYNHCWRHTSVSSGAAAKLCKLFIDSGCFNPAEIFCHVGGIKNYYDTCFNYSATPEIAKLILDTGHSRPEVIGENNDGVKKILEDHHNDERWVALLTHPALKKVIESKTANFNGLAPFGHPIGHASNRNYANIVALLLSSFDIPHDILTSSLKMCQTSVWRKSATETESEKLLKEAIGL
jgi:hypothetical protein